MDPITVITYICACLGGILLLLCIILAGFLLASYCKKEGYLQGNYLSRNTTQSILGQRYIIVSPEDHDLKEDGNVLLQRYDGERWHALNILDYIKQKCNKLHKIYHINFILFNISFVEFLENEHIDGSLLSKHMLDHDGRSSPRKASIRIVSELDLKKGNLKKKQLQPSATKDTPPVQKKLFWRKRKQTSINGKCGCFIINRYLQIKHISHFSY